MKTLDFILIYGGLFVQYCYILYFYKDFNKRIEKLEKKLNDVEKNWMYLHQDVNKILSKIREICKI